MSIVKKHNPEKCVMLSLPSLFHCTLLVYLDNALNIYCSLFVKKVKSINCTGQYENKCNKIESWCLSVTLREQSLFLAELVGHCLPYDDKPWQKKALNIVVNCRGRIPPSPGWSRFRGRSRTSWVEQLMGPPNNVD